jgi:hypothetical protein
MIMTDHDKFVCAARLYSRVLKDSVWIVLRYPFSTEIEENYPAAKASLGLRPRQRSKWKIWPHPFVSPDGKGAYSLADNWEQAQKS